MNRHCVCVLHPE